MPFSAESYNGPTKKNRLSQIGPNSQKGAGRGFMIYTVLMLMSLSNKNTLILSEKY